MIITLIITIIINRNLFYPRSGTGWTVYPLLSAYFRNYIIYHHQQTSQFSHYIISGISSTISSLNLILKTIIIVKNFSLNYDQISISIYYSYSINYIFTSSCWCNLIQERPNFNTMIKQIQVENIRLNLRQ